MLYMFDVVGGMAGKFGGMRMDGEGATHKKKAYGGRPTVSAYKPGGKVARPTGQYKAIKLLLFGECVSATNDCKLTVSSQAPQGKYSSKVAGGVNEEW